MMGWPVGAVHLNVANLKRELAFYEQSIGLVVDRREGSTAYLRPAGGGDDLVVLTEIANGQASSGGTGLYHFAIRVPTRGDLAQVLRHFAETSVPLQGMSDHLVSEAIYLADPEGNGIEVYRDRPREEWPYNAGQLEMGTEALDIRSVMSTIDASAGWNGLPQGTIMGHMHLHVSNIAATESFYRDCIGMDVVVRYGPSASFLSYDGYHHHLGTNVWRRGLASPIRENTLGLRWWELTPPSVEVAAERLAAAGVPTVTREDGLLVRDPAGNAVLLKA